MKSTFTLIFFMFCFHSFMATASQIKGNIREKGTGNPIESADVILLKEGTVTVSHVLTESNGHFLLPDIGAGKYSLMVRLLGYDVYTQDSIIIRSSSAPALDLGIIELQPLEIGITEVVIEGTKRQVVYKLDKKIIDASNALMSSGGTAVDILENTPAIRVDADGEVTFRGSSGFKVYIDGKPSFYSGSQALQQIPAGQIENIEIITTPSARYNTDGEVGMINIITKKNKQQGINGMVNVYGSTALSNGVDFLLSQQHNKLQWHLAGHWNQPIRESDFEQRKTTIVDHITTTSTSIGPRKGKNYHYGLRGGIDYSFSPRTSVNAELQIVYDKFTREGDLDYTETHTDANGTSTPHNNNSRDDFDLHSTVNIGKAGFSHKFNDNGHTLTEVSWQVLNKILSNISRVIFSTSKGNVNKAIVPGKMKYAGPYNVILFTITLIAKPDFWKVVINITLTWRMAITACNSGIRRKKSSTGVKTSTTHFISNVESIRFI